MTIGVSNFQPETFEQANPMFTANDAVNKMINEGIQTYYAQPMAQQKLNEAQYNNQILGSQAQYAPDMAKADLGYKQAQIPYLGSETNLNNMEAQYVPQKYALQQQMMTYRNTRFGPDYQLVRYVDSLPPPLRATWLAQNGDRYYKAVSNVLSQTQNGGGQQDISYLPPLPQGSNNSLPQQPQYPAVPAGNPAMASVISRGNNNSQYHPPINNSAPNQYKIPVNNSINNLPQIPSNNILPDQKNYFSPTPDQVNQLKASAQMFANKGLTSPKLTDRYQQGLALGNLLNEPKVNDMFNVLAKYGGLQGSANAQINRFANPQEYADYQSAKVQLPALISGGIKMIEGMPTSDAGMKSAYSAFKMANDLIFTNPEASMRYYNNGKQLVDAELSSLQKAANPVFNVNRITPSVPFSLNSNVPRGTQSSMVRVITPDGRRLKISKSSLQSAIKMGAKVL